MEKQNISSGFQQVDNAQHQFLAQFLEDVAALPAVSQGFEQQLALLAIRPGDHVLDVGCGIGLQALAMARLAGEKGRVVGTDISTVMVDIAGSRTAGSGLPLEFLAADAVAQPFADQSFDAVRTERVLMYVPDTQAVLHEFKRLLKPGGRLVVFDFDWDGILIAHKDKILTRKIVRYAADSFPNGRIGADLFRQLRKAGLENVQVQPSGYWGTSALLLQVMKKVYEGMLQTGVEQGVFSQADIDAWWLALDQDARDGDFFMSFQGFIGFGMCRQEL